MKAAVVFQKGEMPRYTENFPEPIIQNDEQLLISVKASAIKHLDKSRASGKHYSTENNEFKPTIVGGDGVGLLEDGTRVFALGISGMMAEKAIINKSQMVKLPEGIDDATAAALPNAVAGSAMALRFRAQIKVGETVLINGATGFTGKIAVQIAKHYGAKKIIVTGRNSQSLEELKLLGADELLLTTDDAQFLSQLQESHQQTPIDIIIDYLWGHTAEIILKALKGNGSFSPKTRFVSVGSLTGETIQLTSEILRSIDLKISGSGLGSWTKQEMQCLVTEIIPEMLQLAAENKLQLETLEVKLQDIENWWDLDISNGKRMVVTI